MVATVSRICDAITTLLSNSNQIPFQKQHNNSKCKLHVNKTQVHYHKFTKHDAHIPNSSNNSFTTKARVNNYNSKTKSSFNCHANHFLKINAASAPRIQITNSKLNSVNNSDNKINHITMSANESPRTNPFTPPQTPRVTFLTHSTPNTNTSVNNTQTSSSPENRYIELSGKEPIFVDLVGLLNIVTNVLHVERNAKTVVSKLTSRRFVENLRILIPTQNLNSVSKTLKKKIAKLMMLIKLRPIMTPIYNLTTHRMTTTVLHQFLQRILQLL